MAQIIDYSSCGDNDTNTRECIMHTFTSFINPNPFTTYDYEFDL